MADTDALGTTIITDPTAWPPAHSPGQRWFRTHVAEGGSLLLNEQPEYYADPFGYYLSCVEALRDKGAAFITWHDVLDQEIPDGLAIILQFDVDGGPRSFVRLADRLRDVGVRATAMVHRRARDWYRYDLEDLDVSWLQGLENDGWAIGYHNNSIGNVQGLEGMGNYSPAVLEAAAESFANDVAFLRGHFDLRTFTHHGGNHLNRLTPVPADAPVCVDRGPNPSLWEHIDSSFSDGGFVSRPTTLQQRCRAHETGLHFFRNHPVKYANYQPPFDLPPLDPSEAPPSPDQDLEAMRRESAAVSTRWLQARLEHRLADRLTEDTPTKPLTDRLVDHEALEPHLATFMARRKPQVRRQYPWPPGDPRAYWWRLLATFGTSARRVLNVGALPADRRDETTAFLRPDAVVTELDIDPGRQPDVLGDIAAPPDELRGRFDLVLLFGLPYVSNPAAALRGCLDVLAPGGTALLGGAGATHPSRGGRWFPDSRPIWRDDLPPIEHPTLRGQLWSFDATSVAQLVDGVDGAVTESWGHYWWIGIGL